MQKYFYKAIDGSGQEVEGEREANDEYELAKLLKARGLVMIASHLEEKKKFDPNNIEINIPFLNRASFVDKLMFVRNLQIMIAAGIALPKALTIIIMQTENKRLKQVLTEIHESILKGESLSSCAKRYPDIFSNFFCGMVAIGEETGNLDVVLKDLAYQMEKEYKLTEKVKGAMTYPSVILSVMFMLGIGMMVFVVPQLLSVFAGMGLEEKDMPVTTQMLIKIGDFFGQTINVVIFLGVIIGIIAAIYIFAKTKQGKRYFDNAFIKLPVLGHLTKKSNIASIIGNFSILLSSGIPVLQSLDILSGSIDNVFFKESLESSKEKIQKGDKLSASLTPYKDLYTSSVVQMIAIGEETGMTSDILMKLSTFYEEEVSRAADNLTTIIEPILMVIVAIVVGFFASALFTPIYSSLGSI